MYLELCWIYKLALFFSLRIICNVLECKARFGHVIWEWAGLLDPLGFCLKQPYSSYYVPHFSSFHSLYYWNFFEKLPETKCLVTLRRNSTASLSALVQPLCFGHFSSNGQLNLKFQEKHQTQREIFINIIYFFVILVHFLHSLCFFLCLVRCSQKIYSAWRHCI